MGEMDPVSGLFDRIHDQRLVAPNGIEIHAIIKIEFLN